MYVTPDRNLIQQMRRKAFEFYGQSGRVPHKGAFNFMIEQGLERELKYLQELEGSGNSEAIRAEREKFVTYKKRAFRRDRKSPTPATAAGKAAT